MKSKAAIQVEPGGPLVVDEIDIPDTRSRRPGREANGPVWHRPAMTRRADRGTWQWTLDRRDIRALAPGLESSRI